MKQRLTDEFINAVLPFVDRRHIDDIKMKTAMILSKYSIAEESTELIVYEGDVNENMLRRFLMAKAAAGCSPNTLRYYKNKKLSDYDQHTIDVFYKGSKPIAWMPLPEPYEPKEE